MSKINAKPVKVFSRWRPVPGYEGRYEVSEAGDVRSLGNAKRPVPRTLKQQRHGQGYPTVTLYKGQQGRNQGEKVKVAVLVLLAFVGPRPEGQRDSCHKDGDKGNSAKSNLYWGSRADNVADSRAHGTIAAGKRNGSARLTEDDVLAIRRRAIRETGAALATEYQVSPATISNIVNRVNWSHV